MVRKLNYEKQKTPHQVLSAIDEQEKLFAELVVILGYPQAIAYKLAYPDSKANINSASASASRLLSAPHIQRHLKTLYRYYCAGSLITFSEGKIKY
ncbi:MAG: hypothetical protein SNI70_06085 [Rikenellaceae bacterium]